MGIAAPKTSASPTKLEHGPILRAKNIRKSYHLGEEDLVILKNVDLTLRRGEFVAIEGRSGSGKSTLLHILGGLDSPTQGTVEFNDVEYTSRPSGLLEAPVLRWLRTFPPLARLLVYAAVIIVAFIGCAVLSHELIARLVAHQRLPGGAGSARVFYSVTMLLGVLTAMIIAIAVYLRWEGSLLVFLALWVGPNIILYACSGPPQRLVVLIPVVLLITVFAFFAVINTYLVESPVCRLRNTEFGFVFQFYHLLPELNVLENTLVSPLIEKSWLGFALNKDELAFRAKTLLEELGLGHRLKHKPNQLSGGERQRVAIARALMNNPKVLFADEPTGNLDFETGRQIMAVLERLHREKNQTIVMVTHDRSLASQADRVLVLRDGKLEKPSDAAGGRQSGER